MLSLKTSKKAFNGRGFFLACRCEGIFFFFFKQENAGVVLVWP